MANPIKVSAIELYKISVEYDDGLKGELDLRKASAQSEIKIPDNMDEFRKVFIHDKTKDFTWENGASICKNASHKILDLKRLAKSLNIKI